jgi:hypothetical protein
MNKYVTIVGVIVGSHVVRCLSEHAYYMQCAGVWNSIFTWNSPTCRALRWTADSVMTNVVSIISLEVAKLMNLNFFSNYK